MMTGMRPSAVGPMSSSKLPPRAHDVSQHQDQFTLGAVVLQLLHAVVAVGIAHAAAFFPGVRRLLMPAVYSVVK